MKATKNWVLAVLLLIPVINAHAWPWPDTGQTKCYNNTTEITCPSPGEPFYGQDAQYQGPARSYTKLGQNGQVLSASATYADGWVMTRDNVTNLVWEMKTDNDGIHDNDRTFTWCDRNPATNGGNQGTCGTGTGDAATDTEAFIQALNAAHYGGFSDWRLPTIEELSSLINLSTFPGPTIDADWFPNTRSSNYWSSTTHGLYTNYAWPVDFSGCINIGYYKSVNWYVRAVRGSSTEQAVLTDNGNGTVTNTTTGLMWQKATASGTYTWQQALAYVVSLNASKFAGYTDWRLPDRNELQSLLDYSRGNPAIDPLLASDTVSSYYWSSTSCAYSADHALRVSFYIGFFDLDIKSDNLHVRAVRAGQSGSLGQSNLLVISAASPQQAGTPFDVTVTATNASGQTITDFTGEVLLSSSLGDIKSNKIALTNGVGQGQISILSPGQGYLYASGGGLKGTSALIEVQGEGYNSGTVRGVVVNGDNQRIPYATVNMQATTGGSLLTALTDSNGNFTFTGLTRTPYTIWATNLQAMKSAQYAITSWDEIVTLVINEKVSTAERPVLLLAGVMGSSTSSLIWPVLPDSSPTWDDTAWEGGNGYHGLHDPSKAVGWTDLANRLETPYYGYMLEKSLFPVPYDWKRNLDYIVDEYLIKAIDHAKEKSGATKVDIIAHSMGGLVARAYIQNKTKYRNDINKLVMAGTPHQGSVKPYYMYYGGDPSRVDDYEPFTLSDVILGDFYFRTSQYNYVEIYKDNAIYKNSYDKFRKLYQDHAPGLLTLMATDKFLGAFSGTINELAFSWKDVPDNKTLRDLNADFTGGNHFTANGVTAKNLVGTGKDTMDQIYVGLETAFYPYGAPNGVPGYTSGDSTVTAGRATLDNLSADDSREGGHSSLLKVYEDDIVEFITGKPKPAAASMRAASTASGSILTVASHGGVRLYLTDPQDRTLGLNPESGALADGFGNAKAQMAKGNCNLSIPDPAYGAYTLAVTGDSAREFRLSIGFMSTAKTNDYMAMGYQHGSTVYVRFTLNAAAEKPLTVTESPKIPQGIQANPLSSGGNLLTRLSWQVVSDPTVTGYRIYGRLSDEPFMTFLGNTAGTFYDTGHVWSAQADTPVWLYAVSAIKADGTESFLGDFVRNDDRDHDGLTDVQETALGTDMNLADTDGDGLKDGDEHVYGTNPYARDTDGDGYSDQAEVQEGSDPLNSQSTPVGTIIIEAQPDAVNTTAPWSLTGPDGYSNTGAGDRTLNNLPLGNYTLAWRDLAGWSKPANFSETKAVMDVGTTTFVGTYSQITIPVIQVTPSSLHFGYIPMGTTKDLILTVKNIGGSTLTGNATTQAPFRIQSGGSYTLMTGQFQQVTVRYSPSQEGPDTGTVVFTGGGGASVQINGTTKSSGLPWLQLLLGD